MSYTGFIKSAPPVISTVLDGDLVSIANLTGTSGYLKKDGPNWVLDPEVGAPSTSPALTGAPTVPTAPPGTNTNQIASLAFVNNAIALALGTSGVGLLAPTNTVLPIISGTTNINSTLSVSTGTWAGTPTAFLYQWQLGTVDIVGANTQTYIINALDLGSTVRVKVTASNSSGSTIAYSLPSSAIANIGTVDTIPDQFTFTNGTGYALNSPYSGTITVSGVTAATDVPISVVNGSYSINGGPYVTNSGVVRLNDTVSLQVTSAATGGIATTATLTIGTISGTISVTTAVPAFAATSNPVITGTQTVGSSLYLATAGTWTATPVTTYQWNSNGVPISLATGVNYTTTVSDIGTQITCTVTAVSNGVTVVTTSNTITVTNVVSLPVISTSPVISGTQLVGSTLSVSTGTWTNSPTSFSYIWFANGTVISNASGSTYVLTASEGGKSIVVDVGATNSAGTAHNASNTVNIPVPVAAPTMTTAPTISYTPPLYVGNTMTANDGTWTGSPTIARVWLVNDVSTGQTGTTYIPTAGDIGYNVKLYVTATNAGGQATYMTAGYGAVAATPAVLPAWTMSGFNTSGALTVGTVWSSAYTWSGNPTPSITRQWLRNGSTVVGTGSSYTLAAADLGSLISLTETATNSAGSVSDSSNVGYVVGANPPVYSSGATQSPPTAILSASPGESVSVTHGTWTNSPDSYRYDWYVNSTLMQSSSSASYATGIIVAGDMVWVRIYAHNSAGYSTSSYNFSWDVV